MVSAALCALRRSASDVRRRIGFSSTLAGFLALLTVTLGGATAARAQAAGSFGASVTVASFTNVAAARMNSTHNLVVTDQTGSTAFPFYAETLTGAAYVGTKTTSLTVTNFNGASIDDAGDLTYCYYNSGSIRINTRLFNGGTSYTPTYNIYVNGATNAVCVGDGSGTIYYAAGDGTLQTAVPSGGTTFTMTTVTGTPAGVSGIALGFGGNLLLSATGGTYVGTISSTGAWTGSLVTARNFYRYAAYQDLNGVVYIEDASTLGGYQYTLSGGSYTQSAWTKPFGVAAVAYSYNASGSLMVASATAASIQYSSSLSFPAVAVGTADPVEELVLKFTTGGTLGFVTLTTTGGATDFTDAGTGSCTTNGSSHTYAAGDLCTVDVKFTPTTGGTRTGTVTVTNSSSTILATAAVSGVGIGPATVTAPTPYSFGTVNLGSTAKQTITFNFSGSTAVSSVAILTQGATGKDFVALSPDSSTTLCAAQTYAASSSCTVDVVFNPLAIGQRLGAIVLSDASGNALQTEYISGYGKGAVIGYGTVGVTTVAGNGTVKPFVANSSPLLAGLGAVSQVALDGSGNTYIAGTYNGTLGGYIWKLTPAGVLSQFAGTGGTCTAGGQQTGTCAPFTTATSPATTTSPLSVQINEAFGITVDALGNVWWVDPSSDVLFKGNSAGTTVTRVTNNVVSGTPVTSGNLYSNVNISLPTAIAFDGAGNMYLAIDQQENSTRPYYVCVLKVAPDGTITNIAGDTTKAGGVYSGDGGAATSAVLGYISGLAFDPNGNLYLADDDNYQVYRVDPSGNIHLFAGTGGSTDNTSSLPAWNSGTTSTTLATSLQIVPYGVASDAAGNIYISDGASGSAAGSSNRILLVTPAGYAYVYAGAGSSGETNGTLGASTFSRPWGLTFDGQGNLYVADFRTGTTGGTVRKIGPSGGNSASLTFPTATNVGFSDSADDPLSVSLINVGDAALALSVPSTGANPSIASGFTVDSTSTCGLPSASPTFTLAVGASCTYAVDFVPASSGTNAGSLVVSGNVGGGSSAIALSGTGLSTGDSTSTTVAASVSTIDLGQKVNFTAMVHDTTTTATTVTGGVTFSDLVGTTGTSLNGGTAVALSGGSAALSGVTLAGTGTHTITANYAGVSGSFVPSMNTTTVLVNSALVATQAIASETLTQGMVASAFTPVTASGGTTPYAYSVSPALPSGLVISSTTGAISGTPSAASSAVSYTVTVTDATGANQPASFSLTVSAPQSSFTVDSTSDTAATGVASNCAAGHASGTCTLRSAVAAVNVLRNGTATINFDATVFATAQTITLGAGGTMALTGAGETVNINGPGQALLTVSGADTYGILSQANGAAALAISNISLVHGKTNGSGGAVYSTFTALTLTNVTMNNNVASSEGAFNGSSAVVTGSTFNNNSSTGSDGVFYANNLTMSNSTFTGNTSGGQAGVGYARDSYNVTNCVFTNNKALNGVGGTLITNTGGFTITGSTFVGNSASSAGGAINMNASGSLTIQNSTFYGNSAPQGGAINANNVTMINDTVTGNTTTAGAAVYLAGGNGLFNNTIYGNTGGGLQTTSAPGGTDNIVAANSGINCLGSGCPTDPSNILSGSGFLLPLGTYGATTLQTMPAIIGGAAYRVESSSYYSTDEIGDTRPTSGANSSDAGAVQSAVTASWTTQPPASTAVNTNFTAAVTLMEFGNAISLSGPATVSIPVTLTGNGTLTGSPLTTMSASGVATGTFSVSAVGTGDTLTVNGVASNPFNITAPPQIAPTVATVSALSSPYGSSIGLTVTATESGTNGPATGDVVTFGTAGSVGGSFSPATCSIGAAGTCTTTYTPSATLAAGTYTNDITASIAAGTNYLAASASSTLTITAATPTLGTVTFSPAATEVYGTSQAITLSDTLTYPTGAALPTGAVTFVLNGVNYTATCTAANPSTCTATVPATTIAALAVNNYTVTAAIAAAGNYAAAAGTSATFSITAATPTLGTVTFSPAATEPYGTSAAITITEPLTFTGTAPTGVVSFVLNSATYTATCGTTSPATCTATVPGSVIAGLAVNSYTVTASITAAGNYKAATGTSATFTITATTPTFGTMTFSPAATEPFGTSQIITISDPLTYTGALPTGAVKFVLNAVSYTATCTGVSPATCSATVPAATIAALPVNTYTVTATLAAAGNYNAATGTSGTFAITAITPTVATVSAVSAPFGSTTAITVTATESGTGGAVTGGIVTFGLAGTATGTFSAPTCTLAAAGTCTVTFTPTGTLPAGTYANDITAAFAAVGNYAAANATSTLTITTIAPTVATITPIVSPYGSTTGVTITATESGTTGGPTTGGVVTFGVTAPATGTFSPATCTLGATGTCTTTYIPSGTLATGPYPGDITATFATVGNYSAATTTTSLQILLATPTITLTSSANPAILQSAVTFTATVTPPAGSLFAGDAVTFYDNTTQTALASIALNAGVARFTTSSLAVGSHSITAIFPGDAGFSTVTSLAVVQLIEDFTLVISPAPGSSTTLTVPPGGEATYTFALSMSNGLTFPAGVLLSATGAPAGATVTISPSSVSAGSGAVQVVMTVQTPAATGALHHNDPFSRTLAPVALALLLLPFSSRLRKRAKRLGKVLTLGIFLLAGAALTSALTGCGYNTGFFSTHPETYTITVTGTSGTLSHSSNVTLIVE